MHLQEESGSGFSISSNQIVTGSTKVTPEPSFLQAAQTRLAQPLLVPRVLQPPDHLGSPALDLLGMAMFFLQWGDQNWTQYPDVASQVLYRGEASCPLARLFLTQPRSLLAAFAARMHCWLMVSLSIRILRAFSAELLPSRSAPGCAGARGYPCPGAGPAFAFVEPSCGS